MMQDNKFNLGDILTHKKYGGKYKVIFSGDIDQVNNFMVIELIQYGGGHSVESTYLPHFIRELNLDIKEKSRYTWGEYEHLKYYLKKASVKYTELAEFMYPDGYRDGDMWVIV